MELRVRHQPKDLCFLHADESSTKPHPTVMKSSEIALFRAREPTLVKIHACVFTKSISEAQVFTRLKY